MKVYLFSIGEPTTEVAKWAWERLGHEVILLQDPKTSFYQKYLEFLNIAKHDEKLIRTDADVIPLKRVNELVEHFKNQKDLWWMTGKAFCYIRNDIIDGGINLMDDHIVKLGLQHFHEFKKDTRPETRLSRVPELMTPRRFMAQTVFIGLHGYKQKDEDIARVMKVKAERKQLKDWDLELIEKMNEIS